MKKGKQECLARILGHITANELIKFARKSVDEFIKSETMKTPTKKKAVMKEYNKNKKLFDSVFPVKHSLYELYRTRSGSWKFRKRAKNGEILNHSYNSKALAIKGMKVDFELTRAMSEFGFKQIK